MDLVTYLIGFAAKEDDREDEAMAKFQEVIERFPKSPLYGDAWMMVGEHYFAAAEWQKAMDAYKHIPDDAATSDLATFKIAWCEWKLGNTIQAAKDFKRVLDKAVEAERTGTEAQRRRSASLRDEALEYLVVVFTEDRSISREGGVRLPRLDRRRAVLARRHDQGRRELRRRRPSGSARNDAFRFLIKMDPDVDQGRRVPARHRRRTGTARSTSSARRTRSRSCSTTTARNTRVGQGAEATARRSRARSRRPRSSSRVTATNIHGEAQRREKLLKLPKQNGCATRPIGSHDLLALYTKAADAYEQYLAAFGAAKSAAEKAIEMRYYRADILCFKLGKVEAAGDEYLAVGKSAPVGKYHKDALLNAMNAFEAARPKDTAGRRKLYDVDKKFGEAIDLYATLFPADPTLVGVIFKNGQMFYDYGEYDEAIKRFGVIVTKYPKDPNAGPAGDRILSALNKAQDYENIEDWARKLKTAPSFAAQGPAGPPRAPDRRLDPEERRQVRRRRQVREGRDVLPARAEGDDRRARSRRRR